MGMPSKLKHFNVFVNGTSYLHKTPELTLPKLSRKMEEYRGGGMPGPVQIDLGQEAMEIEWTLGGIERDMLRLYGKSTADGVMLRFAGAYQDETSELWMAVEIVVRGRFKELDFGTAKPGDDTTVKATMPLAYYKLSINGSTEIEIDVLNSILNIGGIDSLADVRKIIGV
ncbi:phage major tail tube protein [Burkholderia sp. Bp8992]|uniref:phage major tail tube protein n=1 Tax=Burkholderia sp. Bp8992 TaxID=2184554 RepID=UPI000F578D37|nr:phage major tail tube protein [Burkholderia sp. Bp8992]RQS30258.1 phage major tail tube protein [Burkholderia sp. Bp8992]